MSYRKTVLLGLAFGLLAVSSAHTQTEMTAGAWKTWVLASGRQFRPSAPPDTAASRAEIAELKAIDRDAKAVRTVGLWAGAPSSRWNEVGIRLLTGKGGEPRRVLTYLNVALYDAMVAAWEAKYAYIRPRPSRLDRSLSVVGSVPNSPSYPDERAVAAGAASSVLATFYPNEAANLKSMAEEAGRSSLIAGIAYPSDVAAGFELGKKVAEAVIARSKTDGSDAKWDGKMPTGPGLWTGTNPASVTQPLVKPWVMTSANQFRPGPPPAFDSEQKKTELAEVKALMASRTSVQTELANFWQFGAGGRNAVYWTEWVARKLAQYRLEDDPPRAARAYLLPNVALFDSSISCFEAKYTYWAARPFQLDPDLKPLFATPNHPSYPSAHSCMTGAAALVLSELFPAEAANLIAIEKEASESRIWAGIHFRSDIEAGRSVARGVAGAVIERAGQDGSQ
jgi:PAP2 superfamily